MVYAMDVCSILKGKVSGHAARVGMIQLSTRRRAPRKTMSALCQLWEALWPHPCNCDMFWYTDMYTVYICNINIYIDYIVIYCVYYDTLWDVRLALFISFHIVRALKLVRWQVFSLAQMNPTSVSWFYQRLVFHADCKRGDRCHGWKACKHLHKRILFKLSASAHIRCSNCFHTNKSFAWTFSSGKPQHCK